jgi:hypothetical protein
LITLHILFTEKHWSGFGSCCFDLGDCWLFHISKIVTSHQIVKGLINLINLLIY